MNVAQTQAHDSLTGIFKTPIDIEFTLPNGTTRIEQIRMQDSAQSFGLLLVEDGLHCLGASGACFEAIQPLRVEGVDDIAHRLGGAAQVAGVVLDPERREIFAVNNDIEDTAVVMPYDAHGNVAFMASARRDQFPGLIRSRHARTAGDGRGAHRIGASLHQCLR